MVFKICLNRRLTVNSTLHISRTHTYALSPGATNTEVVKSLRKMISIAASLFLYPKPFGWKYAGGLGATAVGRGVVG
jgi:hypothetical protein